MIRKLKYTGVSVFILLLISIIVFSYDDIKFFYCIDRAEIYTDDNELVKAIEYYNKAIEIDDTIHGTYLNAAILYAELKDYKKSEDMFKNSMSINKDDPAVYFNLGLLYIIIEEEEKALNMFEKTIELDNTFYNSYLNMADILKQQGKYEESKYYYNEYLKYKPDNIDIENI